MATDFFGRILRDDLPNPASSPELFESVLTRRVIAFFIDCAIMMVLIVAVSVAVGLLGLLTLGLAWLALPVIVPVVFVAYYAVTLGSHSRGTLGMRAMDIVLTPTRDKPLDGWMAMLHVVVFWITCSVLTPFILAIGLITNRRQLLHDLLLGVLMVRRSPMVRHWRTYSLGEQRA